MLTLQDIRAAASRLEGVAHKTPVLTSTQLDARCGNSVFLKCENFQRVGAFKFRGAYNALSQLPESARQKGVVTYSSGNHAQGIALAAKLLNMPATIVMPQDAPLPKIEATRNYGAKIIFYERDEGDRKAIAEKISAEEGKTVIPPFDHEHIIAGQGTAGLELAEEVGSLDVFLAPIGGGGLMSGCAIAIKALNPDCEIYGVETETGDDVKRSLEAGKIISIPVPQTIADGMQTTAPGRLTFEIMQKHLSDVLLVSDEDLKSAMRFLLERMKTLVEPSGAAALAAVLKYAPGRWKNKKIGVILSGGNVDLNNLSQLIAN